LNQANYEKLMSGDTDWIYTAASVVGHEFVHAAGHFKKAGVPCECDDDPPPGGTGCVITWENRIRRDLPKSARGGIRTEY
jgi:hypothetical protein